jgi:Toprim domain/CHC2 zinc finger
MTILADRILAARAISISDVAQRLGLRLRCATGSEFVGPCPRCGGDDRFSINWKKSIFNCRKCGKAGDVIDLVRHALGVDFREAVDYLVGEGPHDARPSLRVVPAAESHADADEEAARHAAWAMRIWSEGLDPHSTPVSTYLATRALELPDEAANSAIRFHPACPFFKGATTAAMVCLVRDIVTDKPVAIHRTALTADGQKAIVNGRDRTCLGPIAGGVVKITPDDAVTTVLAIAEGLETVLSMRQIPEVGARTPIWAALNAGGLAAFPVLSGVESIFIGVDADEAGRRAAQEVGSRWRRAGREGYLVEPRHDGQDLNDVVRRRARN